MLLLSKQTCQPAEDPRCPPGRCETECRVGVYCIQLAFQVIQARAFPRGVTTMAETAKAHIAKRVNGARLWERLEALAQFGATATGGVNRQALSDEEVPARAQLVRWGEAIGLTASTDAVGNLFLRYAGSEPNQPAVMVGSHIDTQPTGGKYDGAYGVIAALEGIEGMVASGVRPRRSIDVVAWMNEEGSRFAPGMMGSAVFAGRRKLQDVLGIRDKNGITVE